MSTVLAWWHDKVWRCHLEKTEHKTPTLSKPAARGNVPGDRRENKQTFWCTYLKEAKSLPNNSELKIWPWHWTLDRQMRKDETFFFLQRVISILSKDVGFFLPTEATLEKKSMMRRNSDYRRIVTILLLITVWSISSQLLSEFGELKVYVGGHWISWIPVDG